MWLHAVVVAPVDVVVEAAVVLVVLGADVVDVVARVVVVTFLGLLGLLLHAAKHDRGARDGGERPARGPHPSKSSGRTESRNCLN